MIYAVTVNRKYQYVKVFKILKKMNESTNPLSKAAEKLIGRFILKKKGEGLE